MRTRTDSLACVLTVTKSISRALQNFVFFVIFQNRKNPKKSGILRSALVDVNGVGLGNCCRRLTRGEEIRTVKVEEHLETIDEDEDRKPEYPPVCDVGLPGVVVYVLLQVEALQDHALPYGGKYVRSFISQPQKDGLDWTY